jgi:hypothetical protein
MGLEPGFRPMRLLVAYPGLQQHPCPHKRKEQRGQAVPYPHAESMSNHLDHTVKLVPRRLSMFQLLPAVLSGDWKMRQTDNLQYSQFEVRDF